MHRGRLETRLTEDLYDRGDEAVIWRIIQNADRARLHPARRVNDEPQSKRAPDAHTVGHIERWLEQPDRRDLHRLRPHGRLVAGAPPSCEVRYDGDTAGIIEEE